VGILQSGKTQNPGYLISKAYYTRALRSKEIAPEFATGNTQLANRDSSFMTSAILKNFAMGNNRIAVDARVIDRKTSFVLKRFLLWSVVRGPWSFSSISFPTTTFLRRRVQHQSIVFLPGKQVSIPSTFSGNPGSQNI